MQQITLDFRNRRIIINTDTQLLTDDMRSDITKNILLFYFRDKQAYLKGDNFTLDFENRKIILNVSFDLNLADEYSKDLIAPAALFDFADTAVAWEDLLDMLGYAMANKFNEEYEDYWSTVEFLLSFMQREDKE